MIVVSADILMVGKVVATLFFHEHMVSIVKVVLSDGTSNGGEGGGDAVISRARCEYRDGRMGRSMVGKVAATLFFREHVVIIVMVVVGRDE